MTKRRWSIEDYINRLLDIATEARVNSKPALEMTAMKQLSNYINGGWVEPQGDEFLDVENPSTGIGCSTIALISSR